VFEVRVEPDGTPQQVGRARRIVPVVLHLGEVGEQRGRLAAGPDAGLQHGLGLVVPAAFQQHDAVRDMAAFRQAVDLDEARGRRQQLGREAVGQRGKDGAVQRVRRVPVLLELRVQHLVAPFLARHDHLAAVFVTGRDDIVDGGRRGGGGRAGAEGGEQASEHGGSPEGDASHYWR
jgi:hypothetical protein